MFAVSAALNAAACQAAELVPPLRLPDALRALHGEACSNPKTQPLPNGSLLLSCMSTQKSERDGETRQLSHFAVQRKADGTLAAYKLVDYREGSSLRTKVGTHYRFNLSGFLAKYQSESAFGMKRAMTWNLAAMPPTLTAESEGGNRDCKEAIDVGGASSETPELVSPLCSVDYAHARQVCSFDALVCESDALRIQKVHGVSIPVRAAGSGADALSCAVAVGGEKAEVLLGQNRRGTRFRIAAEDDSAHGELRLFLAAEDKTPQAAPEGAADSAPYDHFELWLASDALRSRCVEAGDRAAYCQGRSQLESLRATLLPTGQHKVSIQSPGTSAARLSLLAAQWGPKYLSLSLRGELYKWSKEGALTVLYSDSEAGKQRDTLLATATSDPQHPETWGQLATKPVCSPPLLPLLRPTAPRP